MTRTTPGTLVFPGSFVWGAATAAFQIEGAAHLEGRRDSIWDAFCRVPGAIADDHDGEVACDHYYRSADDVELMAGLNLGAYRFSTSWARIRPDGGAVNPAGMDFYSRLVDDLLDRGIDPWVTLYHWDLPQALEDAGGWPVRDTAERFVEFALTVHDALGDRVRVWNTVNEPWCSAFLGYGNGHHAPGRQDHRLALAAAHHLLLAHGLTAAELRSRDPGATVGLALNFEPVAPADPEDDGDVDAARRVDGQLNRFFLEPVFHGAYPEDVVADTEHLGLLDHVRDGDMAVIATPIDVLGVNYYHGQVVTGRPRADGPHGRPPTARPVGPHLPAAEGVHRAPRGLPTTAMGWEIDPDGLSELLLRLHTDHTGPAGTWLTVTENGAAFEDVVAADGSVHDPRRRDYLRDHIAAVHRAIAAGADVQGYFVWSLLDNFEWAWGYTRRFGIVHVDYATLARTTKTSGHWYAQVAADNAISIDSEDMLG